MFVLMAAGGLMATAQLKPIAKDFHLDTIPVTLIGITLPALTFALTIDRVLNGLTRPARRSSSAATRQTRAAGKRRGEGVFTLPQ